ALRELGGSHSYQPPPSWFSLTDDDRSLQRADAVVQVVVETAAAHRVQIAGFTLLPGQERTDLIDFGTVGVFGMRVGKHLMVDAVVVDEQDARAGADGQRRLAGRVIHNQDR